MAYTAIKSHLNVREEDTNLEFPTLKSLIPFLVLIVAKKNVKNGKNNSDKKNKERMSIINANKRSCLNKLSVRCKATLIITVIIIPSMGPLEEGKESKVKAGVAIIVLVPPRPHRVKEIIIIITSRFLKSKLTCRPKK